MEKEPQVLKTPESEMSPHDKEVFAKLESTVHLLDGIFPQEGGGLSEEQFQTKMKWTTEAMPNMWVLEKGIHDEEYNHMSLALLNLIASSPRLNGLRLDFNQIMYNNLEYLEGKFEESKGKWAIANTILDDIRYLAETPDEAALDFMKRHLGDLKELILNSKELGAVRRVYFPCLEVIMASPQTRDPEDVEIKNLVKEYFKLHPEDVGTMGYCMQRGYAKEKEPAQWLYAMAVLPLRDLLKSYDVDAMKLVKAWLASDAENNMYYVFVNNFNSMKWLEHEQPGIIKFLTEKLGIYDFDRYPRSLLFDQYNNYENTKLPYGILSYPRSDHNGAFYRSAVSLARLKDQLSDQYLIRVVECEDKIELVKRLHNFKQKYGNDHKISFAILGGHGHKESIQFGEEEKKRSSLTIDDLMIEKAGRVRADRGRGSYFEKGATLILSSCSTGFEEGIGQQLSKLLGLQVIAPNENAQTPDINAEVMGNKLNFSVNYKNASAKAYIGGVLN